MAICNFSFAHYKETLSEIKKTHKFTTYTNSTNNDIILRHDIDTSLKAAIALAEIENSIDIVSTYFIYFSSEFYNSLSLQSSKYINKILSLGHKIGLHYSEEFILQNKLNPSETILSQIDLLEKIFHTKIEAIAAHEAKQFPPSMKINLPSGILNAYSDEFILKRKYLSDSAMFWREGCFCKHYFNHEKLHVLIHPMWWSDTGKSRNEIMNNFIEGDYDLYSPLIKSETQKHNEWAEILQSHDPRLEPNN